MKADAVFSLSRTYRYTLSRVWNEKEPYVMFVGLNPSTADETKNDPTVTRCINFADAWGYGGIIMTNIFAYRSTDPKNLLTVDDPVGPKNDEYLLKTAGDAGLIVCSWGYFPEHEARQGDVRNRTLFPHRLYHLGLTKKGWPRHPLYLKKSVWPIEWKEDT